VSRGIREKKERAKMSMFEKLKTKPSSGSTSPAGSRAPSTTNLALDDDDEDLPPRLSATASHDRIPSPLGHRDDNNDSAASTSASSPVQSKDSFEITNEGFDIDKLRRELTQFTPSAATSSTALEEDPQEVLRQQWTGTASTLGATRSASSLHSNWPASTIDPFSSLDDGPARSHSAGAARFDSSPALPPTTTFSFGDSNGDLAWSDDVTSTVDKATNGGRTSFDDSPPDPTSSTFAWDHNHTSHKGLANQNPW
jgi:hypothetical protein